MGLATLRRYHPDPYPELETPKPERPVVNPVTSAPINPAQDTTTLPINVEATGEGTQSPAKPVNTKKTKG